MLGHARVLTSVRNSGNNDVEEEDVDRDMDDDRGDDAMTNNDNASVNSTCAQPPPPSGLTPGY